MDHQRSHCDRALANQPRRSSYRGLGKRGKEKQPMNPFGSLGLACGDSDGLLYQDHATIHPPALRVFSLGSPGKHP